MLPFLAAEGAPRLRDEAASLQGEEDRRAGSLRCGFAGDLQERLYGTRSLVFPSLVSELALLKTVTAENAMCKIQ